MNIQKTIARVVSTAAGFVPAAVLAQGLTGGVEFQGTAQGDLISAITNIVNFLLVVAALIAGVFLIIAGVRFITSGGDSDQAEKAKNQILYAVIGLIVIGLAAALANFIISAIQAT